MEGEDSIINSDQQHSTNDEPTIQQGTDSPDSTEHLIQDILDTMTQNPQDEQVQISGSELLQNILKWTEILNSGLKKAIITTILDSMDSHYDEKTMMINGCIILRGFIISGDVRFEYDRMVRILLRMVAPPLQEGKVLNVGIILLNRLARQNEKEKLTFGNLGAIDTMLTIIAIRLNEKNCDEVMEIAWQTMASATDETPENCARFIHANGMNTFLQCSKVFPDKPKLLGNMMGLMGNVAEVKHLRCELMKPAYVNVFSILLDTTSDFDLSCKACEVLTHLVSEGKAAWGMVSPSRTYILERMVNAIDMWNMTTQRQISYNSLRPIMELLSKFDTPEGQYFAIWALCNLTTTNPNRYCPMVEKENALITLRELVMVPQPYKINMLANKVIDLCRRFKENPEQVEQASNANGAGNAVI